MYQIQTDLNLRRTVGGCEKLSRDAEMQITEELDPSVVDQGVKELWASFHGELPQASKTTTVGGAGFTGKRAKKKKKTGGKQSTLGTSSFAQANQMTRKDETKLAPYLNLPIH